MGNLLKYKQMFRTSTLVATATIASALKLSTSTQELKVADDLVDMATTKEACKNTAYELGLTLGGCNVPFSFKGVATKGCYTFKAGFLHLQSHHRWFREDD